MKTIYSYTVQSDNSIKCQLFTCGTTTVYIIAMHTSYVTNYDETDEWWYSDNIVIPTDI